VPLSPLPSPHLPAAEAIRSVTINEGDRQIPMTKKTAAQAPDFKRGDKRLEIYFQSLPR
jgi:hypothetical protein